MRVRVGALSDVGRERAHNEDALAIVAEHQLYVVADGMGGHNVGEVASRLAVEAVVEFVRGARERETTPPSGHASGRSPEHDLLVAALKTANATVMERAVGASSGMGTTIVTALVSPDARELHVAHVGDSRCYRARGEQLELLTRDHSLLNEYRERMPDAPAEELEHIPTNVITRAIGMHAQVEVDVLADTPREGDVYLLCSDGLSGMLRDDEILAALRSSSDVQRVAARLVELANERGGEDNITVMVLAFE